MPAFVPFIILVLFLASMVNGCGNNDEGNNDENDETENSRNTFSKDEVINEIKECNEEDGQPCVCGALVQCTSSLDESEAVHMEKNINGKIVKVAEIEQLSEEDIRRAELFTACKFSPTKLCTLIVENNYIENEVWQDSKKEVKLEPDKGTLDINCSYMICNYGEGIIFFKNSGQIFKDEMREKAEELFGEEDLFTNLSEDEILLVTAIYGEAAACSEASWQAIANIIMNRVGAYEWKKYNNPIDILKNTGFDAFTNPNAPYKEAENYFKNRDYSNENVEKMIKAVIPILRKETNDLTDGCILYYSPKAQKALHDKYPESYKEKPNWDFAKLEEVKVDGAENDDFKFYKYK